MSEHVHPEARGLHSRSHEPDGQGFDASRVPEGPLADYFFDGKTGRGISDAEWDEQRRRLREHGDDPFDS